MKISTLWQITGVALVLVVTHILAFRAGSAAAQTASAPILDEIDRKHDQLAAMLRSAQQGNVASAGPLLSQEDKDRQSCISLAGQVATLSLALNDARQRHEADEGEAADDATGNVAASENSPPDDGPKMCVARCPVPADPDRTG